MREIKIIPNNPDLAGMAEVIPGVTFAAEGGQDIKMTLITPWNKQKTYPLVVFIQGSGWTFPNVGYNMPHLGDVAREGFVVAMVTHRSANDGHPFPAFLQDVKSAIRFLRAHADEYHIDPARVAAYGTSSGGNTALLLGLTGDDERYRSAVHPEQSDAVTAVVDVFGPTDMVSLFQPEKAQDNGYYERLVGHRWDTPEAAQAAHDMSPLCIVQEGRKLPPMLLLYGDADRVVPYDQGERMYQRLCGAGHDARMVRVTGAEHEGNFWSAAVRAEIINYLKEHV